MSCYQWEAGTLVLPSVEFTRVKDAVLLAQKTHNKTLYEASQKFWKLIPAKAKRDLPTYHRWASAFAYGNDPVSEPTFWHDGKQKKNDIPKLPGYPGGDRGLASDLSHLLGWVALRNRTTPTRVTQAMIDEQNPATNKTTSFNMGESGIVFDRTKRTVHWYVGENNHARDYGRDHPVSQALFKVLDTVKWTRATGGKILGNDEYNRGSRYEGGGGNYVIDEYGPKIKRAPAHSYAYDRYQPVNRHQLVSRW